MFMVLSVSVFGFSTGTSVIAFNPYFAGGNLGISRSILAAH
jgi:hypothetical protein